MASNKSEITLGPVLFNWPVETWRDFYFRMADEAPVTCVYLGETICSKRAPFFERHYDDVAARLVDAGKTVVFSTLAQVMLKLDRRMVESVCSTKGAICEVNDISALWHLSGRPHHIGPHVNVYNEDTLELLARKGATNVCLPVELPGETIAVLGPAAAGLGVTLETQVFGRMPLALSARCYHARAHGRTRDSCQYVCENDPDGLALDTVEQSPFLAINGIQTLSYNYLNLVGDLDLLRDFGVSRFRLSPHSCNMVRIAQIFRSALDGDITTGEASEQLDALGVPAPFSNGFLHHQSGHRWIAGTAA